MKETQNAYSCCTPIRWCLVLSDTFAFILSASFRGPWELEAALSDFSRAKQHRMQYATQDIDSQCIQALFHADLMSDTVFLQNVNNVASGGAAVVGGTRAADNNHIDEFENIGAEAELPAVMSDSNADAADASLPGSQ